MKFDPAEASGVETETAGEQSSSRAVEWVGRGMQKKSLDDKQSVGSRK